MTNKVSNRKLAANRANAQLSTGPRTVEGRHKSSRNALKHGLLSGQILLEHENPEELQALSDGLRADLQPVGALEEALVEEIVAGFWLRRRALRVETAVMEYQHGLEMHRVETQWASSSVRSDSKWQSQKRALRAAASMMGSELLDRIQRYATAKERQIYRALHELQRLQADRGSAMTAVPIAVDVDLAGGGNPG